MTHPITVAILTVSDRSSRGETADTSGPALSELSQQKLAAKVVATACVPDDPDKIGHTLTGWADQLAPDLILTTGGTGLSPRDVTPEATRHILEREHPGLVQLMHLRCYQKTPMTFLSRGVAGTYLNSLIINLPGSRKGAVECLEALLDVLPHAISTLRGEVKDHGKVSR
jgi:molybdenum cofactor synthesis domain-containing protein